jgi:hypothetical protein
MTPPPPAAVRFHRLAIQEYLKARRWYARRSLTAEQHFRDAVDDVVPSDRGGTRPRDRLPGAVSVVAGAAVPLLAVLSVAEPDGRDDHGGRSRPSPSGLLAAANTVSDLDGLSRSVMRPRLHWHQSKRRATRKPKSELWSAAPFEYRAAARHSETSNAHDPPRRTRASRRSSGFPTLAGSDTVSVV